MENVSANTLEKERVFRPFIKAPIRICCARWKHDIIVNEKESYVEVSVYDKLTETYDLIQTLPKYRS